MSLLLQSPVVRILRNPAAMQRQASTWLRAGCRIGFVPTMGCLHDGHLSLVHEARRQVGKKGVVVVSIYVNPTQFGPQEDFIRYPRPFRHDARLCREAGVDVIFNPSDSAMYPNRDSGDPSTYVLEERLGSILEGASRPTHFRGVSTVVAKLFNCVRPNVAVFGAKDWQQSRVIKRMIIDLNFPVKLVVAETHRELDGLAMSSRNRYLTPSERTQATVLWKSLEDLRTYLKQIGKPISATQLEQRVRRLIASQPDARLDYVAFFDSETLNEKKQVTSATHMALAVFIGKTRLIDNGALG